jgi:hypothetical protein
MPDRNRLARMGRKRKTQFPLVHTYCLKWHKRLLVKRRLVSFEIDCSGSGFLGLLFGLTQQLCLPIPTPSPSTDEIRSAYSFYQLSFQCNRKRTGSVESLHDWTSVPNSTRLPLLLLVLFFVWKAQYLFGTIISIDTPKLSFSRPTGSRGLFGDCNRGTVASPETFCSSDPKCSRVE